MCDKRSSPSSSSWLLLHTGCARVNTQIVPQSTDYNTCFSPCMKDLCRPRVEMLTAVLRKTMYCVFWVRWLLDPEGEGTRSFGALAAAYQTSRRNIPEDDSLKVFYSGIRSHENCSRDISFSWWWLWMIQGVHKSRRPVAGGRWPWRLKFLRWCLIFEGLQYGNCFMSTLQRLVYLRDFQMFGKIAQFLTLIFYFVAVLSAYQKQLESFEMWCWRRMEKISWTGRVRNVEVLLRVRSRGISYMK